MIKTHFALASIPSREQGLKAVIDSIINQVDYVHVYLDGYDLRPSFLKHDKIMVVRSFDTSPGDMGKLLPYRLYHNHQAYYLTGDDDLIYPENYVSVMKQKIDQYDRKAIISFHGARLPDHPIKSYYNDPAIQRSHFSSPLNRDMRIHVPGTGVMGMFTGTLDINVNDKIASIYRNMADIYIGCLAKIQNVDVICAKRQRDWIKPNKSLNEPIENTIWGRSRNNDQAHTCLLNSAFSGA